MPIRTILNRWNQWVWRQRLRPQVRWARAHAALFRYAETRPIPLAAFKAHRLPITTDCSGFVTGLLYAVGAPDPNGLDYNGQGYTGTLLDRRRMISRDSIRYGDLIVFGAAPGVHVVMAISRGPDPLVVSHGRAGLDVMRLGQMAQGFPGQPVTCLSAFVPKGY